MLSPALLLVARLLQGLSVGGEYGASATYISEMAERTQRGFWLVFLDVTLTGGMLAALLLLILLQRVLSEQQLYDWGWRIPFAVGAVLVIVAWWIRRGIYETRSFTHASVPEAGAWPRLGAPSHSTRRTLLPSWRSRPPLTRLLHLHGVHAEVADQQRRLLQAGGVAGDDPAAHDVPVPATARRLACRPGRASTHAARVICRILRLSAYRS